MNIDKRLLKYLGQYRWWFAGVIVPALVASLAIVLQADSLSKIVDRIFLQKQTLADVTVLLTMFLVLSGARAVFNWLSSSLAHTVAAFVKIDIREKLSTHFVELGPSLTTHKQTGELHSTLMDGVERLDVYFSQFLPQLFLSVFIPILILIFVFPIDLLSGFVFLFTAPLIPVFMILIGDIAQALTRKQWTALNRMSAFFLDILQGLTTLKILGISEKQSTKIKKITEDFASTTFSVLRIAFLSALVLELLSTISTAIIAVEIGLRLIYAKMEFQPSFFLLILAPEFYQPLRQLGARFHAGMDGYTAAQDIFKVLETKPLLSKTGTIRRLDFPIKYDNVTFSYPDKTEPAIRNVSFEINKGDHIALVGPSGAGKTTLVNLLLKFVEPNEGRILIGNELLENIDTKFWREQISWVPQKTFLFNTTILENIKIAKPDATNDEINSAIKFAHIHDFIETLPDGLETVVGEQGAHLSGGQAQRISLARAFLKNASLLIFDEPTSNLDFETEAIITNAIREIGTQKTVITIAHRLETIKNANQIFVFSKGKLIDHGSHVQLLKSCKEYVSFINELKA